jgi:hypothetical protein
MMFFGLLKEADEFPVRPSQFLKQLNRASLTRPLSKGNVLSSIKKRSR